MPPTTSSRSARLESAAFYVLLATVVLAPLAFWSSPYIALDAVKTIVIALGTLISAILYGLVAFKEKSLALPPRNMVLIGVLIALSLAASAFASGHFIKSFFGQGFETGTASFIILLLVSAAVACAAVYRRAERAVVIYAGLTASYLILWILHALRFAFGTNFISLGILNTLTTSVLGDWYSLGAFSLVIIIISLLALAFLPLSRRMKVAYWVLVVVAFLGALVINAPFVWQAAALVFLGLAIYLPSTRPHTHASGAHISMLSRIAWVPVIAFIIAAVFAWKGPVIAGPLINDMNASFSEITLPWQMTLDVGTGTLKSSPLFGAGPNRFTQAFLANKPAAINTTDAWGVEFTNGFGLIPTFAVTGGLIGLVLWLLLFVYIGILGRRSLRASALPTDHATRFIVISSFVSAVFLWILSIIYVPSEPMLFFMLVLTGIWLGTAMSAGSLKPLVLQTSGRTAKYFSPVLSILVIVAIVWGLIFVKNTVALAYFAGGLKQLTVVNNPAGADIDFRAANDLNPMDVYWQARAEAALAQAQTLAASIAAGAGGATASSSQSVAAQTVAFGNEAFSDAAHAIASDPTNYYNYLSEARVAEFAVTLNMPNGYQTGVKAYEGAIALNPGNPSLYLSLARLEANQNQLDAALQTVGAALQVKSDYLDAVFLLSQIEAAKGNLPDAITAAQFAIGLNSTNPLLYFQLGILQYTSGQYAAAATTLAQAIKIEPDYANAQYFLGLAYARLGRYPDAAAQFQQLATSNPSNQEVALILANLEAGRSPFTGEAPAQAATPPEKRTSLPIPDTTNPAAPTTSNAPSKH